MRDGDRERDWMKRLARAAEFLEALEAGHIYQKREGFQIREVRILMNTRGAGDSLLVAKALEGDDKVVAFVGGRTVVEALLTWRQKEAGKGIKWRPDTPYPGGNGSG